MSQPMMADDMVIFARVVELNGFTAAARAFGFPKVRVSRAVASLEAALGVRLLERTTRRIRLTDAGQSVLAHCRRVALEMEAARVAALPVNGAATLRVAVDAGYGRLLVLPLLPRFLERYPQVAVELLADDAGPGQEPAHVVVRTAGTGAWDGAIERLGSPPMILCATPAYLAAQGTPTAPAQLAVHTLLRAAVPGTGGLRLAKDGGDVTLPVSPRLAAGDPSVLHAAVAAGLGIGVLPEFLCRQGLAMRRLVRLLPDWEVADRPEVVACLPAAQSANPAARGFVSFVAANFVAALAGGNVQGS